MKLNNKGMSLVELLISIVLIGIVLTFLFSLLTDLKNETDNNNYAYNNQVNRTEIIYNIEKDLLKYTLLGVEDASSNNKLILKFHFKKGDNKQITILESEEVTYKDEFGDNNSKYYLKYTDYDGNLNTYLMKGARINTCGKFVFDVDNYSNTYHFKINIDVYNNPYHERNNEDKNNAVDDIELTYLNYLDELDRNNTLYLTSSDNIGICD